MMRKLDYISDGRSGYIVYTDEEGTIQLYYEFGGGDCVVIIHIPAVEEWTSITNRPLSERNSILSFIAEQAIRDQAPDCFYNFTGNFIEILKK